MDCLEDLKLPHSSLVRLDKVGLVFVVGEQTLISNQPHNIWVTLDLVDVSVFVQELAPDAIRTVSGSKENFAVLFLPLDYLFWSEILSSVSKLTVFTIAAPTILAE